MARDYFHEVAVYFKTSNVVADPISVRRVPLKDGLDGLCEKKNDRFVIKISKKLPENYSIDVLIHEIAHAVSWDKEEDIHGPSWGRAYSKVYRMYLRKFLDNDN